MEKIGDLKVGAYIKKVSKAQARESLRAFSHSNQRAERKEGVSIYYRRRGWKYLIAHSKAKLESKELLSKERRFGTPSQVQYLTYMRS